MTVGEEDDGESGSGRGCGDTCLEVYGTSGHREDYGAEGEDRGGRAEDVGVGGSGCGHDGVPFRWHLPSAGLLRPATGKADKGSRFR
ncbi:hypothetical protein GCM10010247_52440 [Streptomyces calvus]|nr:hypothetical protein GCM10010247_52440 [Streptomyces calvus]